MLNSAERQAIQHQRDNEYRDYLNACLDAFLDEAIEFPDYPWPDRLDSRRTYPALSRSKDRRVLSVWPEVFRESLQRFVLVGKPALEDTLWVLDPGSELQWLGPYTLANVTRGVLSSCRQKKLVHRSVAFGLVSDLDLAHMVKTLEGL